MCKRRPGSPTYQINHLIESMLVPGQSKHYAKLENGGKPPIDKIFSYSTANTYRNCNIRFFLWCREHHGCKEFQQCRPYIETFLDESYITMGRSAWTVWKNASALCKLFMISTNDLSIELLVRRRADIQKNRHKNDAFDEDKWADLVKFCLATGLRLCELKRLTIDDIYQRADGKTIVHVRRGKGGRYRHVVALDNHPLLLARSAAQNGQTSVFKSIPHDMDTHYYRREFAQKLYKSVARPIDRVPRSERYYCRLDMRGIILDRTAMLIVSRALGHNRIGVTTTYLQGIDLD